MISTPITVRKLVHLNKTDGKHTISEVYKVSSYRFEIE